MGKEGRYGRSGAWAQRAPEGKQHGTMYRLVSEQLWPGR